MSVKVIGMDLALNHGGFVQLVDGELDDFWYITDRAASAALSKEHGIRLKLLKSKDKQMRAIHRLAFLEKVLDQRILVPNQPDLVGIEDYALGMDQGAHYMGEIGGKQDLPLTPSLLSSMLLPYLEDGRAHGLSLLVELAAAARFGPLFGSFKAATAPPAKLLR